MFVPHTFQAALIMMVVSAVCWGSWANTYKLTRNYRFELFYWDYAVGIVVLCLGLALTIGSTPRGADSFVANVHAAATSNLALAVLGGFIFNIANTLLLAAIEIAGLALAFPLSIGIALVEGVVVSYIIQPKGNLGLLAAGVCAATLAVVLIGRAYASIRATRATLSTRGVTICIASGVLMGSFAPLLTKALITHPALTPYTAAVFFSFGALLCCFVFNVYLMKRPLTGAPVRFSDMRHARAADHVAGVIGGLIWGVGLVFNLVAANLTGVSISYAIGQSSPMIAVLWGVFVWKEFAGASRRATVYLWAMFACYVVALVFVAQAYGKS